MHYSDTDNISCLKFNFQEADRKKQRKIKNNKMTTNL